MSENLLYYGDNLDILKRYIKDESVDLIYLDPPFNSNATYNVLFAEHNGTGAAAQIKAFGDTWVWDQTSAEVYRDAVEAGGKVSEALQAFMKLLGTSNMMAYLAMMAPRLVELRRVLKPTGSIYLHCNPTASHYLKLVMDAVFDPRNFRNEIIWKRVSAHSDSKKFGNSHDILFYYTKTDKRKFNKQFQAYDEKYLDSHYNQVDKDGRRYMADNLTATGLTGGGYEYEWHGVTRVWRCPIETMRKLDKEGRIQYTKQGTARFIRYLDEMPGTLMQDIWTDISPINSQAIERLGYPTQKPELLLERIINSSSNKGDIVLDPFCGCGTAIAVANQLKRKWIGIDITHVAINLIKRRLSDAFGEKLKYEVVGEPVSLPDAEQLARQDPYQFQWWALGLVGARPAETKKGADKGIDGRLYFHDEANKTKQVILSVKAGHTSVAHVRDLRGVLDREKADIGVLITFQRSTHPMRVEATEAGFYYSPMWPKSYPRLQILSIEELLEGKRIDMPPLREVNATFKRGAKANRDTGEQGSLPLDD
jgi:DNA modification methylase